ncbi:MAG: ABC transporter ATP-binding protein [Lachnospiraceae bacterium]|nr:ABC transporter ATP-binding protein/permease [Robinsoniella sp.]MDY3765113.1 ABC transporter ATP-binding protein [Lachnospiraceae bacterium]
MFRMLQGISSRRAILPSGVSKCIKNTIQESRRFFVLLILIIAASVIFALLPPLVLGKIVDSLADGKKMFFSMAVGYFFVVAISGLLDAVKESMITVFGQRVTHQIRSAMSEKLNRLPASYYIEQDPGVTTSRFVNDVDTVERLFSSGIISMAADVCKLVSILIVIFTKSIGLGLMLTGTTPFLFWMTRTFQKRMQKAQLESRIAVGRTSQQIPETMRNIRTIRILGQENYMMHRYGEAIDQGYRAQEKSNFYDAIYSPIVVSVSAFLIGIMMAASAQNGAIQQFFGMSAGTAAAVIAYVGNFFDPLENIGMEIQNIQSAVAGVGRINEFLRETEQKRSVLPRPERKEAVDLSGVCFRYKDSEPEIFHNFNLTVKEGESILLAGRTGAGKSTLVKLIAGLYQPNQGSVRVFGVSPDSIPEKEKRRWFGYVEQQFHLIPGTVGDQISLHDPQVSESEIEQSLCTVGLWGAVKMLPAGIHTPCTESLFSQGQFQLLSIARAIVLNPRLLLLDEITANLDSRTEEQVLDALKAASRNRTVISISHRLFEQLKDENTKILNI